MIISARYVAYVKIAVLSQECRSSTCSALLGERLLPLLGVGWFLRSGILVLLVKSTAVVSELSKRIATEISQE